MSFWYSHARAWRATGRSRQLLALAVFALAAGGVVTWLSREAGTERSSAAEPTWNQDARQRYALSIDSRVGLLLPGESGAQIQHFDQHLSGALHLRVFGHEDSGIRVGFQLDGFDYTLAGLTNDGMITGLGVPFAVLFAPNGRPASFAFPDGLERAPRALLREVVQTFQLVQPATSPGAAGMRGWTSSEEHGMGRYLAYYEPRPDGIVRKRKTQYTRVDLPFASDASAKATRRPGPDSVPEVQLRRSNASYRVADGVAWFERAELDERAIFTLEGRRIGDATVLAELELETTTPSEDLALYTDDAWRPMLIAAADALRAAAQKEASALADLDLEHTLDALDAPTTDRIRARAKLEEALAARPDLAADVARAVREESDANVAASLIHALERVGNSEAQEALVGLIEDDELERRKRLQAIIALGGVSDANDQALGALMGMAYASDQSDLANTALLAAGAAGNSLRGHDSPRAAGLGEQLHGSLRHARDDQEVGVALKAMGNMADPGFAREVTPYVDHESAYVRASAAWALERTGASEATERLAERLGSEESGPVRAAIVSALVELGGPDPVALEAVSKSLPNEPDPDVRYAMVQYLGNHLDSHPKARETLTLLALEDSSGQVRRYAAAVVTGGVHD